MTRSIAAVQLHRSGCCLECTIQSDFGTIRLVALREIGPKPGMCKPRMCQGKVRIASDGLLIQNTRWLGVLARRSDHSFKTSQPVVVSGETVRALAPSLLAATGGNLSGQTRDDPGS